MLALGPWVRPFWDSEQLQPEKIVIPALASSPSGVERLLALLPACFIRSYSVTLGADSSISPGRRMVLIVFILHLME